MYIVLVIDKLGQDFPVCLDKPMQTQIYKTLEEAESVCDSLKATSPNCHYWTLRIC